MERKENFCLSLSKGIVCWPPKRARCFSPAVPSFLSLVFWSVRHLPIPSRGGRRLPWTVDGDCRPTACGKPPSRHLSICTKSDFRRCVTHRCGYCAQTGFLWTQHWHIVLGVQEEIAHDMEMKMQNRPPSRTSQKLVMSLKPHTIELIHTRWQLKRQITRKAQCVAC